MLNAVKISHNCWSVTRSFLFFFFKVPLHYKKYQFKHLIFVATEEKSLYFHNKNKSVLYFTIYFKYFHYEAFISLTLSISTQRFPEKDKWTPWGTLRRGTLYSHISPSSQPRPQMRTHQSIQKNISASCSSTARSTARLSTLLCILVSIPSWSSGTRHNLAAFGSNLWFVPLDKRFLQHKKRTPTKWHTF